MTKYHYYGGSTIINPQAEAWIDGKWFEGTYHFTRERVIDKLMEGTLKVGPIYNRKLKKEIKSCGGIEQWARAQPEFRPLVESDAEQAVPPLPIARKPPSNRRRR